jgi:serine/threonine-protein kinase SRPK3
MASSVVEREISPPRPLPTATYKVLDSNVLIEEETFSWYNAEKWYPVRIGEVFRSRYQVLLKLGFGSASTIWLCRDLESAPAAVSVSLAVSLTTLRNYRYVALKIYETGHRQALNEVKVLEHLKKIKSSHPGMKLVRLALDSFEVQGRKGSHIVLIQEPLGLSLGDIRQIAGGKLPDDILKPMLVGILLGLDFLHSVAHVVHTGKSEHHFLKSYSFPTHR